MPELHDLITFKNPIFMAYAFYSAVLVLKMFTVMLLTVREGYRHAKESGGRDDASGKAKRKVRFVREGVERARRAHLNDLENLIPFFVIGFLYVLSRPDTNLAVNLYRCVAASRIVHTIVYAVWPLPQPTRFLAFMGAWLPTVYMGCKVALVFY